jgi:hypothetical protein
MLFWTKRRNRRTEKAKKGRNESKNVIGIMSCPYSPVTVDYGGMNEQKGVKRLSRTGLRLPVDLAFG